MISIDKLTHSKKIEKYNNCISVSYILPTYIQWIELDYFIKKIIIKQIFEL